MRFYGKPLCHFRAYERPLALPMIRPDFVLLSHFPAVDTLFISASVVMGQGRE